MSTMSGRLPPLESLRFLEACVRHANFTRAANELGVTPAAVSLRIRDLEAELGTRLFDRSGPRVAPTQAGAALANGMAEALGAIRAAVGDCLAPSTSVRVACAPTFATRWLAPRLARYHALAGAAAIELDVSADLRPGRSFDIAIRTGLGDWPGFVATALMPVEATPMVSPALAATIDLSSPEGLTALPLLPHDAWSRWFREAGVAAPQMRFYADDYPTHELDASAALQGAGAALLSPSFYAPLVREGKLVQPFAHVLRGPASHYILLPSGDTSPVVLRLRDWLQAETTLTG